ncbi:MAG: putative NEK protein kinase [Streblomastix strix]|uniref:Putative NEK protein kinase n=1 Tax=Streblomastix strix TaxID=222440 RepID=A0A5J4WX99_9EUKA|nr:MAG: putative NEK protein kinase [Streblomastix strix]
MIKNAQLVAAVMMLSSQVAKIASQRILMDSKLVVQIVALQCKRIVLHVAIVAVRELCKLLIKLNKDKQINKLELQENPILLKHDYQIIDQKPKAGAFGTVIFARHTKKGNSVAVKQLDYRSADQKSKVDQEYKLMKEAFRTMKKALPSDSFIPLVQPIDFLTSDDRNQAFLILEYCSKGDMRDQIKEMRQRGMKMGEEMCLVYIGEIASALNLMHKNKIIHADLKPENVLFTEDYKVKLTDFGLACRLHDGKEYVTMIGGTQESCITTAVDIWALGVIIYELLALVHPFSHGKANPNSLQIVFSVRDEPPSKFPEGFSKDLEKLIMRMLEKDQTRRITAEQILAVPEVAAKLRR